ncbi:hypothetical protein CLV88_103317 [Shimia abyssi]|uniref:Uncharacterized protein n=1 Tax=Shimia abyssi TaxID=1662395 RepID=A0A2P8FG17_9RHOB|nr:hypothetical protein CLV88_103317 [Shimia abyssi]
MSAERRYRVGITSVFFPHEERYLCARSLGRLATYLLQTDVLVRVHRGRCRELLSLRIRFCHREAVACVAL